jgi:circadian clock protein KaiB
MMNNAKTDKKWILCLYIAGMTSAAETALANLKRLCQEHLDGRYTIEVIDLLERPELAEGDQIFAVPTLVRQLPPPLRKIIGDLADAKKVLVGLDIKKAG